MIPSLEVVKVFPRGFCAGVDRAIQTVERAIEKYGPPVFVYHDIVHNTFVVDALRDRGAVFVERIDGLPKGVPVVFSAHGVPASVVESAENEGVFYIDATCPLVSKVHAQVRHFFERGIETILVGHWGHPEVIGTIGQVPEGWVTLVRTPGDVDTFAPRKDAKGLACVTQTTLSVDDAEFIVKSLRARFPRMLLPAKQDICYATKNRQDAVKAAVRECDVLFVVGSAHSSNSRRLVEVARAAGCADAHLIDSYRDIDWTWLGGKKCLGITSGASAPEVLLDGVIQFLSTRFNILCREIRTREENFVFNVPRVLGVS